MPEMVENAKNIQERSSVPVIADADNGYGNATNVVRTVREYVKAGVAGIHIEDQTFPKRCGHTKGRRVIPKAEAVGKIRAAADVRDERDESFVLIARTDARGAVGGDLDDAIERANAYVDAGADVAFVEGPVDEDEIARIGREVDAPLVYNCVGELGTSPYVEPDALTELGFDLVLYPVASTLTTIAAVHDRLSGLKSEGIDGLADIDRAFAETPLATSTNSPGFPKSSSGSVATCPRRNRKSTVTRSVTTWNNRVVSRLSMSFLHSNGRERTVRRERLRLWIRAFRFGHARPRSPTRRQRVRRVHRTS